MKPIFVSFFFLFLIAFSGLASGQVPQAVALKTNQTITVDGIINPDEWEGVEPIFVNRDTGIDTGGQPTDDSDLSYNLYIAHDGSTLYLGFDISDESIRADSGTNTWDDDCVEIFCDADELGTAQDNDRRGFQLLITTDRRTDAGDQAAIGLSGDEWLATQLKTNGWSAEFALPFTSFDTGGGSPLQVGDIIGFTVNVDDDDTGGTRQGQLWWYAVNADSWNNQEDWGTLLISEEMASLVNAGPDQLVVGGDRVTLSGVGPSDATSFTWTQVAGQDRFTATLEPSANQAQVQFNTPTFDIGFLLTFRLTVVSPSEGTVSDEVTIKVLAPNPPKVAPGNFRIFPQDLGPLGLGCLLEWDPVFDAEQYQIGIKIADTYLWMEVIGTNSYQVKGLSAGQSRTLGIRSENRFSDLGSMDPAKHGAQSEDVTYTAMPNVARPASQKGTRPPLDPVEGVTFKVSHLNINGMNDTNYDDTNDSWDGLYKPEDFWGYLWAQPLFFDHIVYFTGNMFTDGGWFTDLKVQYTQNGSTWVDVPILGIFPDYSFTDARAGKEPFTRYDIFIPTLRGTGIRLYGTPGGFSTFTSVAELEVFGNQSQGPLVVQGIDREVSEGSTVILDGSLTFSTVGPITSYQWTGPLAITNPTSALASFKAPLVSADTLYVFTLQAGDGTNTGSDDDVRILVKNLQTTAVAGPDQSVVEESQATLDGSPSLTTSGNITYLWTQTAGTNVGVSGKTTPTVSFTTPVIWGYTEELTFRLTVNDGLGQPTSMSSDEVTVEVLNTMAWPVYPLEPGYFTDVLHLGHNPPDRILSPLTIQSGTDPLAAFGGEASVMPYPGLEYDFTGTGVTVTRNPMRWTPAYSPNGYFGSEGLDNFQQIYHIYILSPDDRNVRWHCRNDDEIRVWNNGVLVLTRNNWDNNVEQTEEGLVANGTGLKKGLNSITMKFQEGTGGNYIALGITDENDQPFPDLLYSLGPSLILTDAYATRTLPASYQPGVPAAVTLNVKVNPDNKPGAVNIVEQIPPGLSAANVSAPGAVVAGGNISWNLVGAGVKNTTLSYSLTAPQGMANALDFAGTLTFAVTTADIFGTQVLYPVPSAPRSLSVEMLQAAHLSWAAPLTEGTATYNVYRSVNGGGYELIGTTPGATFADKWVVPGNNYAYQVTATNIRSIEGPASRPSPQVSMPTMEIRQAEDFNYDGGKYPWTPAVTLAAKEAPDATTIGTPQEYDYWHPNTGGPGTRTYRPLDNRADGTGVGIEIVEEVDDPGVFHTNIGWIDVGSWWRYTFNVLQAGWVKLEFRVAALSGGTLAAYWDETLVGTVSYQTGNYHIFTWALMEDEIQTTTGPHTLRVQSVSGELNFDTIAVLWNAAPPARQSIWEDNFDSYTSDSDVFSPTVGKWTRGNTTNTAGSWRLWDTDGPDLGTEPANIAGMEDKFMISDSDLSAAGVLLNEEMLSPEVDCADWTKVRLNFNKNYRAYEDPDHTQTAEVDIRSFDPASGWSNWTNLLHLDTTSVPAGLDPAELSDPEVFDLSPYDGKKIQLKFHFFDAEYDYWFAIDKVRVSGVQLPEEIPLPTITLAPPNLTISWTSFGPGQYSVERTTNLKGTWTKVAGPFGQTSYTAPIPADRTVYFRVVSQ